MFSRTAARITLFGQRCRFCVLLECSYSSAEIVFNIVKILFLQNFDISFFYTPGIRSMLRGFIVFVFSLCVCVSVYL